MICLTSSSSDSVPASLVALRLGVVEVAGRDRDDGPVIFSPSRRPFASALSFCRIIALISGGVYVLPGGDHDQPVAALGGPSLWTLYETVPSALGLGVIPATAHEALDRVGHGGDRLVTARRAGQLADETLALSW